MTSAYLTIAANGSQLRVYNRRNTAYHVAKTSDDNKKLLKRLGFKWDRTNKSYFLTDPTDEALAQIKEKVFVEVRKTEYRITF